jgi:two-component system, OmpR family, sensor histidine kinase MprB
MSLRLKLAIGAALLSALVAASVASLGYLTTCKTVTDEAKQSVTTVLTRFADPDGRLVTTLCSGVPADSAISTTDEHADAGLLDDTPGVTVKCVNSSGAVDASLGPNVNNSLRLPVCSGRPGLITQPVSRSAGDDTYAISTLASQSYCIVALRNLEETDNSLDAIKYESIALGAVATVIAALIGMYAAQRATKPVRELTQAAERVAATDDLNTSINISRKDEVGRLGRAFAAMLSALKNSREQEQRFVQDASHELRTPLTSIRTNVDTLVRHDDLDVELKSQIFDDIRGEIAEMANLVDELVQLGATSQSAMLEDIDLKQLITEVAERWRRRTDTPITIDVNDAGTVPSNRALLARAVSNLIDNAVKFGGGQPVEITARSSTIEVRDRGKGINDEDFPRLFDRFYRAASARSAQGSGLGLAIVRESVERVGGEVVAQNSADGGAVFTIKLPAQLVR